VTYDDAWRPPWRTPQIGCCTGMDCRSKPPHRVIASTLKGGLCRECQERNGVAVPERLEPEEQLALGL
jgi:hypothetical protein